MRKIGQQVKFFCAGGSVSGGSGVRRVSGGGPAGVWGRGPDPHVHECVCVCVLVCMFHSKTFCHSYAVTTVLPSTGTLLRCPIETRKKSLIAKIQTTMNAKLLPFFSL